MAGRLALVVPPRPIEVAADTLRTEGLFVIGQTRAIGKLRKVRLEIHDDRGAPERAIGFYRKAIAVQPRAAEAWFNMGVTYARMGDAAQSLASVREAARLGHADAQAYLRSKGERW